MGYLYAVQQDTQSFLLIEFYSSHMLARHVSDLTGPSSGVFFTSFFLQLRNDWTCRAIRVLPHTKSAHTACTKRS